MSGAVCNDWVDCTGIQRMGAARVNTADPEALLVYKDRVQSTVLTLMSHRRPLGCDIKATVRDAALEMGIPLVILAADRDAWEIPGGNGRGCR